MNMSALGALVGLMAASGGLLAFGRWRATAPPNLAMRVGVHRGTRSIAERDSGPLTTYLALLKPRMMDASSVAAARLSGAGRVGGIPQLRLDQVVWGGAGLGMGVLLALWTIVGGATPLALVLLPAIGAVVALLLLDRRIAAQVKRRRMRIEQQLPDVAELLAFAVAAGESIVPALHRVCSMVTGDLSDELRVVVERFVDGLLISLERGTPLVTVVRAQASDARATQQQVLMEQAGRKDVIMLIPVVFLILPTVVVIALFPGLRGLQALTS